MEEIADIQNLNVVGESKQYIVIKLDDEYYGIDISYVDNIVRTQRITRIPKAQKYFKGVINLRGEIIPVMSLRLKFDLKPDEYTNATRIIIIKLEPQSAVGLIVDVRFRDRCRRPSGRKAFRAKPPRRATGP